MIINSTAVYDAMPHPSCWFTKSLEELYTLLNSRADGLRTELARQLLTQYGKNEPTAQPKERLWQRWLRQFDNILIYILLAATVISWLTGHWADGWVIFAVIFINSLFGAIQEGKAEQALESIRSLLKQQCDVLRDGIRQRLDAALLVPGDIILVAAGDKVPADCRLIESNTLKAQESALTGESLTLDKYPDQLCTDTPLAERHNMLYAGTFITQGNAKALVVATGDNTELGQIGQMLKTIESLDTPLLRELGVLGRQLSQWILALSIVIFFFGWIFRAYPLDQLLMVTISLAVAAIPEGLPAVITITMAIGVQRMARRNAIVRRLPAVETLGCVDVICTDKTGTLTANQMMVTRIITASGGYQLSGDGYAATGKITPLDGAPHASSNATLEQLLFAATLCNDAQFSGPERQLQGDPTEGALLVAAEKYGLDVSKIRHTQPRVAELPFDSIRSWMITCHQQPEGQYLWLIKGAPERLLPQFQLTQSSLHFWQAQIAALAGEGLRTLLLASKESDTPSMDAGCRLDDYRIIGIMAMQDPPRAEAIDAIGQCQQAGIKLVMLTGDHIATASAIARQMSLAANPHALTGAELDALDEAALHQRLPYIDIIARATPANKLRLIHAYQKQGHIMAMTGDGINDAPALKQADIGVAMGRSGTDTAKEASAIVLADDNFATLGAAIREGRVIYENLRNTLIFLLPTNGAQALVLMISLLFNTGLPITPIQILWINMVSAITLALPLAFEQGTPSLMQRPPRGAATHLLNRSSWLLIACAAMGMALTAIAGFEWISIVSSSVEESRSFAINLLIGSEIAFLFNCRQAQGTLINLDIFRKNRTIPLAIGAILLLQLLQCYLPWMNHLFGTAPLPIWAWEVIAIISIGYLLLMESVKKITGQARAGG